MRYVVICVLLLGLARGIHAQDGTFSQVFEFGRGLPRSGVWHPDGEQILVNTNDAAWIYTDTLQDVVHLEGLINANYSGDGRWIYGTEEGEIAIYDAQVYSRINLDVALQFAAFSPDSRYLAGITFIGELRVWSGEDFSVQPIPSIGQQISSFTWSPNSQNIALLTDDHELMVISIGHEDVDYAVPLMISGTLVWSADGERILVLNDDSQFAIYNVFDAETPPILIDADTRFDILMPSEEYDSNAYITRILWHPGSQQVLRFYIPLSGESHTVFQLYDVTTGEAIREEQLGGLLYGVTFSPDGQFLALSCSINNSTTYESLQAGYGHRHTWSPNSRYLACSDGFSSQILILDTETSQSVAFDNMPKSGGYLGHYSNQMSWSPQSNRLLIWNGEGILTIWDAQTPQRLARSDTHSYLNLVSFSSEGTMLAAADKLGNLSVWDTESGQHLYVIPAHVNALTTLAWQPGGTLIATRSGVGPTGFQPSDGNLVKVWDGATGQLEQAISHENQVTSVEWNHDGTYLASVSNHGSLNIWNANTRQSRTREDLCLEVPWLNWSRVSNILMISCIGGSHGVTQHTFIDVDLDQEIAIRGSNGIHFPADWIELQDILVATGSDCQPYVPPDDCVVSVSILFDAAGVGMEDGATPDFTIPVFASDPVRLWSADGSYLLIQENNGIQVWNVADRTPSFSRDGTIRAVWSPDSRKIAVVQETETVIINVLTGETLLSLPAINDLTWNSTGTIITGWQGEIRYLWDAESGEILATIPDGLLNWDAGGHRLAIVNQGVVSFWSSE